MHKGYVQLPKPRAAYHFEAFSHKYKLSTWGPMRKKVNALLFVSPKKKSILLEGCLKRGSVTHLWDFGGWTYFLLRHLNLAVLVLQRLGCANAVACVAALKKIRALFRVPVSFGSAEFFSTTTRTQKLLRFKSGEFTDPSTPETSRMKLAWVYDTTVHIARSSVWRCPSYKS